VDGNLVAEAELMATMAATQIVKEGIAPGELEQL
jgi:hypothetical protein